MLERFLNIYVIFGEHLLFFKSWLFSITILVHFWLMLSTYRLLTRFFYYCFHFKIKFALHNFIFKKFCHTLIYLVFFQDLQGHTFYCCCWQIFDCWQMLVLLVSSSCSCSLLFVIVVPFLLYYCRCRLHVKSSILTFIFKLNLHIYCYHFLFIICFRIDFMFVYVCC